MGLLDAMYKSSVIAINAYQGNSPNNIANDMSADDFIALTLDTAQRVKAVELQTAQILAILQDLADRPAAMAIDTPTPKPKAITPKLAMAIQWLVDNPSDIDKSVRWLESNIAIDGDKINRTYWQRAKAHLSVE